MGRMWAEFQDLATHLADDGVFVDAESWWRRASVIVDDLADVVRGEFLLAWLSVGAIDDELLDAVSECESPIEQRLLVWIYMAKRLPACPIHEWSAFDVLPQRVLTAGESTVRVDFLVVGRVDPDKAVRFVVECDGHEFHEKTKDQAAKDKRRDRAIQSLGYPVLHFTGSEIWRNPSRCAAEVADFAVRNLRPAGERDGN